MNNKSIQVLRGRSQEFNQTTSTEVLMDGQPFWDPSTGWLYMGNGDSQLKDLQTIQCDYSKDCLTDEEVENIWKGGNS